MSCCENQHGNRPSVAFHPGTESLMEEANEEAEHKGWCDTELPTNEQTRKEKTNVVESLHAEIDSQVGKA